MYSSYWHQSESNHIILLSLLQFKYDIIVLNICLCIYHTIYYDFQDFFSSVSVVLHLFWSNVTHMHMAFDKISKFRFLLLKWKQSNFQPKFKINKYFWLQNYLIDLSFILPVSQFLYEQLFAMYSCCFDSWTVTLKKEVYFVTWINI